MRLYESSEHTIWTDKYIAKRLLQAHLNADSDAASRRPAIVEKTVNWITKNLRPPLDMIDLGCGPGLYAEIFAKRGYSVTGVDLNRESLRHARRSARANRLPIRYVHGDYLGAFSKRTFDLATCIYCDFGALTRPQQSRFLRNAHRLLKPNGTLIFDVFGPGISSTKSAGKSWEAFGKQGFWSNRAHYVLSETAHFPRARVWGQKYVVLEHNRKPRNFVMWDHYFTAPELTAMLKKAGFRVLEIKQHLIPKSDFASNDVLFVRAQKQDA